SQPPTVHAGAPGRRALRGTGRPLATMAAPVHLTHPAAPLGEPAAGRVDPATDAASALRHTPLAGNGQPVEQREPHGPAPRYGRPDANTAVLAAAPRLDTTHPRWDDAAQGGAARL